MEATAAEKGTTPCMGGDGQGSGQLGYRRPRSQATRLWVMGLATEKQDSIPFSGQGCGDELAKRETDTKTYGFQLV